MAGRELRTGFSTGTAAAAATGAAVKFLLEGIAPDSVAVALPGGGELVVTVAAAGPLPDGGASATVVKDGGDDPDATHKARVSASVRPAAGGVSILGGPGVGTVTRPGLPVAVGQPAINPVPREMIAQAARAAWRAAGRAGEPALEVVVSVADGEIIARRTLNPRLGIVGGISILGTTGLVKPFSHEAYTATIDSALSVAEAAGLGEVVLTTGGKSEKLLMARRPDLEAMAFVQIADFFGHALERAALGGFRRVGLGSFFGKAVKQAQGLYYTHAHDTPLDLGPLAGLLAAAGAPRGLFEAVRGANTARHALEMLRGDGRLALAGVVGPPLLQAARRFLGPGPELWVVVLDFDGTVLFEGRDHAGDMVEAND